VLSFAFVSVIQSLTSGFVFFVGVYVAQFSGRRGGQQLNVGVDERLRGQE
jgi:hypothetical protein